VINPEPDHSPGSSRSVSRRIDMTTSGRRTFIRRSLFVLGAAASGDALTKAVSSNTTEPSSTHSVPVLTSDHQILHHDCGKVVSLPVVNSTIRQGIPGRKFIMVIDLAKCDGCGKCTVACSKM